MKKLSALALVILISASSVYAFGHKGGHGGYGKRGGDFGIYKIVRSLDLTSEQKTQLKELKTAAKQARKDNRGTMKEAYKKDLQGAFVKNKFDEKAYAKTITARSETFASTRAAQLKSILDILTDAQRKVVFDKIAAL